MKNLDCDNPELNRKFKQIQAQDKETEKKQKRSKKQLANAIFKIVTPITKKQNCISCNKKLWYDPCWGTYSATKGPIFVCYKCAPKKTDAFDKTFYLGLYTEEGESLTTSRWSNEKFAPLKPEKGQLFPFRHKKTTHEQLVKEFRGQMSEEN